VVVSIQTFGSYAANFHPHVHALLTDGACTEEGEFLQLPYFDARLVEEVFRCRVLQRLHRAERLSEAFHRSLLGWGQLHPDVPYSDLLAEQGDFLPKSIHLGREPHPLIEAVGGDATGEGEGEAGQGDRLDGGGANAGGPTLRQAEIPTDRRVEHGRAPGGQVEKGSSPDEEPARCREWSYRIDGALQPQRRSGDRPQTYGLALSAPIATNPAQKYGCA
jgi:hypothetical protein